MEGAEIVKRSIRYGRIDTQKVMAVFFGVCTGVVMWLALDFRDEAMIINTSDLVESEVSKRVFIVKMERFQNDFHFRTTLVFMYHLSITLPQRKYCISHHDTELRIGESDKAMPHLKPKSAEFKIAT